MIMHQNDIILGLVLTSLPAVLGVYLFYRTPYRKTAFSLLLLSGFLLRLLMISLDSFLQNWDERFHALVAKNMMEHPFKPMLIAHPVLSYNYQDWWNSHIWVHKQPLFLWQMALSMKIFGISPMAMRLPLAIMGTLAIWMIRGITMRWTRNAEIAFVAAFLTTFTWYGLEMTSGFISLDHNDFTFYFYVTAGIWAWSKYTASRKRVKWTILTGIFVGCAILVKWLTAYVVIGGWALYILLSAERRKKVKSYMHIALAFAISVIVFLPWQLYIMKRFPLESAWSFEYNRLHIWKDLGHEGPWYFHFSLLYYVYHTILVGLLIIGILGAVIAKEFNRKLSWAYLSMIVVVYAFFSIVTTKMPGFVFPVSGLMFILMAAGFYFLFDGVHLYLIKAEVFKKLVIPSLLLILGILCFRPAQIVRHRYDDNLDRNRKINNTLVYKHLDQDMVNTHVILNCPIHEQLELMYFKGGTAYHSYPTEHVLDSLQAAGYKFAAFEFSPSSILPAYILNDPEIIKLKDGLQSDH
jgi:4-amino-4-deoxy-L-arabinose transferase